MKIVRIIAVAASACVLGIALSAAPSFAATASSNEVSLLAVGDDLIHTTVYQAAKTSTGYDFSTLFSHVKKDVKAADIAVINQETIFTDDSPSGYPCFGTPRSLGYAITKAGFDVVQCATNHAMDRGTKAIKVTLDYWSKKHPQVKVLGIHKSKAAARKITVIEKNGIRIAMLNYTYGLNGISLPSGKGYMVDRLNSKKKIANDIRRAKKISDFVVVFGHMGTEYKTTPDSSQLAWTKWFARQGVDLYVGTHPHVLEPVKWRKGKGNHRMLCYYSLGNFVCNTYQFDTTLGGMAKVVIKKNKSGRAYIKSWKLTPLVTHKSTYGKYFTVYKLEDYTVALAHKHFLRGSLGSHFCPKSLRKRFTEITGLKM